MNAKRLPVDEFLQIVPQAVLLDVRSPAEYAHAHIPGAVSLPLFNNEERAIVGTAYKQQSREAAIKAGLDFFGPKMRTMVEEVEALAAQNSNAAHGGLKKLCIYCWRGGMRSGAVSWLLSLYGFEVYVLAGGYKRYRNWALEKLAQPYHLKIIGGYTGSGKTALLQELEKEGKTIIDLEALASHKGSAFGNIGMPQQPTQEMFENKLALELHHKTKLFQAPILWLEDESQRIGTINIPNAFWQTMRSAPLYFLDIPFDARLQQIMQEYGGLDKEKMAGAIHRISKRLGPLETKNALQFLADGNMEESFRILLHYYDKQYRKALHNRQNLANLLRTIESPGVGLHNAASILNTAAAL